MTHKDLAIFSLVEKVDSSHPNGLVDSLLAYNMGEVVEVINDSSDSDYSGPCE